MWWGNLSQNNQCIIKKLTIFEKVHDFCDNLCATNNTVTVQDVFRETCIATDADDLNVKY